jgi:hypothetical protein
VPVQKLSSAGWRASLRRVSNVRAILMVLLVALAACRPRQTGPDANYEKGSRIYQQLYATQLDDAYGDPRMNEAVDLLKQVDPRSVDAESARRMLGSIDTGRATLKKQQAARDKMAAAASASIARQPQIDPQQVIAANTPDAGVTADPYGPGASIAEINAASGGCLTAGEPFREKETNVTGTVYRVGAGAQCADRLPGLTGQVVLAGADGRVYRRLQEPAKAPVADAGPAAASPAPPVDAGVLPPPPKPKPPPPPKAPDVPPGDDPADAGGTLYIPGMPMPDSLTNPEPPPPEPQQ